MGVVVSTVSDDDEMHADDEEGGEEEDEEEATQETQRLKGVDVRLSDQSEAHLLIGVQRRHLPKGASRSIRAS